MSITYTKVNEPVKKNCYVFEYSFEHGDADSYTNDSITHHNMTEEQLVSYIKKSEEISQMIDDSRSYNTDLPEIFEKMCISDTFRIPVEQDNYAKLNLSNYYAASGIENIFYYNQDGIKFEVKVSS